MKVTLARLNAIETCGKSFILTDIKPIYNYVEGRKVGEPIGNTYTVVLPERKFETLRIRIDGPILLDGPENGIPVKINNLRLDIKWSAKEGNYIAATASGIEAIKE